MRLVGEVAQAAQPLPAARTDWSAGQAVGIRVGPEGALTDEEGVAVSQARSRAVHPGHAALRLETAAVARAAATVAACDRLDS
ncbi:MAG TPA: hypothetical protein ENH80_11940 [Phycisphaerae bacterium]|nr:hypothetical protein [Phycisphaerae bacterium]HDZ44637.1 hypothetical protein [Phycisphaerae bacterium]